MDNVSPTRCNAWIHLGDFYVRFRSTDGPFPTNIP